MNIYARPLASIKKEKQNMKKAFVIIQFFFCLTIHGQEYKYVNTHGLNVREGAGTNFEIVDEVHRGDKVEEISKEKGWIKIRTEKGNEGFVFSKYLSNDLASIDDSSKGEEDDNSSIYLIVGLVIYGLYKLFFGGSSSSDSSSKQKNKQQTSLKPQKVPKIDCYHCKNCHLKVETVNQPNAHNCPNDTFHN